jgi:predicted ATP-grasp superfamily ATP-dependent carboligase
MPVTDVTTHAVALNQERIRQHAAVAVPPLDAFELVADKQRLLERAVACGIPIPITTPVGGRAELEEVLGRVSYPVVVKPARSRVRTPGGWLRTSVHYAASQAELRRLFDQTHYLGAHPSLLQERIEGPGVGVFVLFDRGRAVAAFAHKRLRERPPSGGVSVLRESVPLDASLKAQAERLLGPLGWHGVAMLEYKRDARTGWCFLMEVNGRFWGSLQLAVDAGIDFPYLAWQLALGQRLHDAPAYKVGIKSRWLLGDLDHLLLRLFKRERDLNLPAGAPSRFATVLAFLKFVDRGLRYEVLRASDVRPFLHELRGYVASELQESRAEAALVAIAPHSGQRC